MRVLVFEDNPKMATAVQRGLEDRGFAADVALGGSEGEDRAASGVYDVVVLDIMMPDRDGLEVCRNLRRRGCPVWILMLTALGSTNDKVHGLDAGADDYLAKPFEFEELVARLKAMHRRAAGTETRFLKYEDLELDLYSRVVQRGGVKVDLTNKEFSLLEHLMRNPDRVLSRTQIGEKVWAVNFEPTSNVVDVYISSLRRKVDRGQPHELIRTVKGAGYRFGSAE
jgi:DNA-binding response OmpR family regulator